MQFQESTAGNTLARTLGYILSYSIFTTILFFILTFVHHGTIVWWHVVLITLAIILVARAIAWWLS